MTESPTTQKKVVLICTCSGSCPSMASIDFWTLAERVRLELAEDVHFLLLHPRLCEEDGERLMAHILGNDILAITHACAEKRQEKLLRDGFRKAGVPMDAIHWMPVSMAQEDTDTVFEKIKTAVRRQPSPAGKEA